MKSSTSQTPGFEHGNGHLQDFHPKDTQNGGTRLEHLGLLEFIPNLMQSTTSSSSF